MSTPTPPLAARTATWLTAVLVALACLALAAVPAAADDGVEDAPADDWLAYDHGGVMAGSVGDRALELAIPYFTDCEGGSTLVTAQCGGSPGRWSGAKNPVAFCTHHAGRPSWLAPAQFRNAVDQAAEMWTATEAAVGVRYEGDCTNGSRWDEQNSVNEVGFDDHRDVVRGSAAAVAHGSWLNQPRFGVPSSREFVEFDIVIDHTLNVPLACLESVVAHEMGHALGFGHSDDPTDLMYHSFNPSDLDTCRGVASRQEVRRIQELYGVNRAPVFPAAVDRAVTPGGPASVSMVATDPEGDPLTYVWEQVSGAAVAVEAADATLRFTAPEGEGARLQFRVTARDRFLHRASATVGVTTGGGGVGDVLPGHAPSLAEFAPGAASALLTWESAPGATSYRFCTGVPGTTPADCEDLADASAVVSWDTVLGAAGSAEERRVFSAGARVTSMAGCTAGGCTPAGDGPLAGGLRWGAWDIDYDFLAMAYDVPGTSVRFTIGAVANITGDARRFTVYSGTEADPLARRIHACGNVEPGRVCFALLGPQDRDHLSTVTIVSERPGTPTTEHRVTVR